MHSTVSLRDGPGVRGRPFGRDNPGRKPGSKNKCSLISATLLEGEREGLLRKAIELAKRGNVSMLKFLLGRLLPRDRLISIDLPRIVSANDAASALKHILRAVCTGAISPTEAAALATLISPLMEDVAGKAASCELIPSLADHLRSPDRE